MITSELSFPKLTAPMNNMRCIAVAFMVLIKLNPPCFPEHRAMTFDPCFPEHRAMTFDPASLNTEP